ncbi:hypothetical protein LPJ38_16745 [Bradyrhizobium daqingense]|uniref:Uncharacterized protein n=1 Tax=Bradyrhizobium daqingense TaxID=993502 RepID=A0A562LV24_9BRAD|nr:hypothetical protein [Bradyrhizobium daqingense]TWI11413.1 hypothetical protein IQ17_00563 [Bradyrhizobium daqingense]UFS92297.1 hypothetical protein LPJ38_16745 [Bradyrhizobium daqingense]
MVGKVIRWSIALIVLIALVLTYLPSFITDSIYKNVEDITDGEMPATVTAFQSGPDVVSTVGGSGEGLNCSLPPWANILFDGERNSRQKRHLVLQRFRQACVFHDLCYRHGLATYGYNQNDCDRILQNAAFRLCVYIRNGSQDGGAARCQSDSKLVLAGVSLGGYDAYRGWDRSTHFEFDSDPSRSNGFQVSRVVSHPFKAALPAKYANDPDQVILMFENLRSNLAVTCITCANVPVLEWTTDPNAVSAELRSVGVTRLPDVLLRRVPMLTETMPVWLPPRRRHAAPHLLVDGAGKDHLIWMSRNNPENSVSCIVGADAARLLTNTSPIRDLCSVDAGPSLTRVEIDMFASAPLPMEVPGSPDVIYATSISPQKTREHHLSFCSRSASRKVEGASDDDRSKCVTFPEAEVRDGAGLGAFQNFPLVRPGQQIYFARDIAQRTDSRLMAAWQRAFGNTYSPDGALLVIDVAPPPVDREPLSAKLKKIVRFDIDDRFDPMMPITRKVDDLRFLSLEATKTSVHLRMVDFAKDNPSVGNVPLMMSNGEVELDRSWAQRPMLVLETRDARPRTKLVFSRGDVVIDPGKPVSAATTEALALQTLVFERDAAAPSNMPFVKSAGAACRIVYEFEPGRTDWPCYRAFDPERTMRASPATRLRASQMLVGRFTQAAGHGIAFPDLCLKSEPIVLKPQGSTFVPLSETAGWKGFQRTITCEPLDAASVVSRPITQKAP